MFHYYLFLLTLANWFSFSTSFGSEAHDAKNCNILGEGGVVISKNLVSNVLNEHLGSLSCGVQLRTIPVS